MRRNAILHNMPTQEIVRVVVVWCLCVIRQSMKIQRAKNCRRVVGAFHSVSVCQWTVRDHRDRGLCFSAIDDSSSGSYNSVYVCQLTVSDHTNGGQYAFLLDGSSSGVHAIQCLCVNGQSVTIQTEGYAFLQCMARVAGACILIILMSVCQWTISNKKDGVVCRYKR